jgi:hypothetical protein
MQKKAWREIVYATRLGTHNSPFCLCGSQCTVIKGVFVFRPAVIKWLINNFFPYFNIYAGPRNSRYCEAAAALPAKGTDVPELF